MTDKMKDAESMKDRLVILRKLDPVECAYICGRIEQTDRFEQTIKELKAQLAAMNEKRAG